MAKEKASKGAIPTQPKRDKTVVFSLISLVVVLSLLLLLGSVFVYYYVQESTSGYPINDISDEPVSSCQYNGESYSEGDSFKDSDDCNTCTCIDGRAACTKMYCADEDNGLQDEESSLVEQGEKMVYTNTFYPDLEIVYPNDWEVFVSRDRIESETNTDSDWDKYYKDNEIYSYDIYLTKENHELKFEISAPILGGIGWGPPSCYTSYEKEYELIANNDVVRIKDGTGYYYSLDFFEKSITKEEDFVSVLNAMDNAVNENDYVICVYNDTREMVDTTYPYNEVPTLEDNPTAMINITFSHLGILDEDILSKADEILSESTINNYRVN